MPMCMHNKPSNIILTGTRDIFVFGQCNLWSILFARWVISDYLYNINRGVKYKVRKP